MSRFQMIASSLLLVSAAGLTANQAAQPGHGHNTAADGSKIAAQLDQNEMTLAKMATAAEEHSKGRAISVVSAVNEQGQVGVHVYCVAGDAAAPKIMMCHVDTATGKVKGMKEVQEFPAGHAQEHHAPGAGREHADDHGAAAVKMTNQPAEVGCGMCIYEMPDVESCKLAIMLDGKPYLVEGATWPNHDFCDAKQQALVSGGLDGDKFVATRVEPKK